MAQLKIDRMMYAFAERAQVKILISATTTAWCFEFYNDADGDGFGGAFLGRAFKAADACAWFRGYLSARGIVDAPDPRKVLS